jgi:hypothetical protein
MQVFVGSIDLKIELCCIMLKLLVSVSVKEDAAYVERFKERENSSVHTAKIFKKQ